MHDSKTGYTYKYTYDSLGRLMSGSVSNSSGVILSTRQTYDSNNQLTGQQWRIGTTNYSESYTYSKTTGLLATHKPAVGNTLTYGYDELQRLSSVTGGIYRKTYNYWDGEADNTTTTRVSQLYYDLPTDITYTYGYDDNGNIIASMVNGSVTYYAYDEQNQLLESRSVGKTYTYTYDAAGNIQTASDGTTTHNYTYDTGVWKDLLKYFDGEEIVYDASGNPTTYYNGTEWNMTWAEGRRLVTAKKADNSLEVTYTYDSDGLRLTKKVGNTTYQYYYAGGKLMRQTDGTTTLDFFYDASGNPYALKYNNTLYYYITNLQGDVLHIVNTSGTPVVSYSYSPYGVIESVTDNSGFNLGTINPLRYRGYVYDEESGLYYLQSRYYDPSTCRFINADAYASTGQGVLGNNMFVYCLNNPINFLDTTGEIAVTTLILIASIVVGVASGGYTAYKTYKAGWDIGDILWYTFGATLSGFLTIYTLGMSAYQLYTQYCMLNGITPVSEIQFSQTQQEYVEVYGASQAPTSGIPNSTYNKVDADGVTIVSTTQYNSAGKPEYRIDYYTGNSPHTHFDKVAHELLYDHVHYFFYNTDGQPCGKCVGPLK